MHVDRRIISAAVAPCRYFAQCPAHPQFLGSYTAGFIPQVAVVIRDAVTRRVGDGLVHAPVGHLDNHEFVTWEQEIVAIDSNSNSVFSEMQYRKASSGILVW